MNKAELSERLKNACAAVTAAEQELSDIDARFGDADHGLTMSKIAGAISGALEEPADGIQEMLDGAAMAVMEINGGSYTINKPLTTGGSKNCLVFYNAQVTNESTITVLPYDDPKVEDSGLFVLYGDTMEGSAFYNRGTVNIQNYSYVAIQADRVENISSMDWRMEAQLSTSERTWVKSI